MVQDHDSTPAGIAHTGPYRIVGVTETSTAPSDDGHVNRGLDETLGVRIIEVNADRVVATWIVGDEHLQPFGIVHGGAYCAVNESVASIAAQAWLGDQGLVVGVNNNTDFLRQAGVGAEVTTTGTPIHRGRRSQLWLVQSADAAGRLLARGQVRLAHIDGTLPPEYRERLGI